MLRRVALLRTDVSEELSPSIYQGDKIGELGTTLAVTSNRSTLLTANAVPSSPILVTLMMEAIRSSKRRLYQEPHYLTSKKTPLFNILERYYCEVKQF
jgi:hypothetical protein